MIDMIPGSGGGGIVEADIDHDAIMNVGTATHDDIDDFIGRDNVFHHDEAVGLNDETVYL